MTPWNGLSHILVCGAPIISTQHLGMIHFVFLSVEHLLSLCSALEHLIFVLVCWSTVYHLCSTWERFLSMHIPTNFPMIGALPPALLVMGKFDHIPELTDASVFQMWKTQIILVLGCEGVYNHVSEGTDPADFVEFASELLVPAKPGTPTTAEQKLIQEWLKEDAIAKDIICCHFSPMILQLIPQGWSSTAHDAWKLLHSHFDHIN